MASLQDDIMILEIFKQSTGERQAGTLASDVDARQLHMLRYLPTHPPTCAVVDCGAVIQRLQCRAAHVGRPSHQALHTEAGKKANEAGAHFKLYLTLGTPRQQQLCVNANN
jgi:hypothetical protein